MAFESKNLSALSYANGQTVWGYVTADTIKQVRDPSYFDAARDMLRPGDPIHIAAGDGNALAAAEPDGVGFLYARCFK